MTTNAQAALIAAASTMTPTNGDWHAEYGCKLIEARAQHFLEWLNRQDEDTAPPNPWTTPVVVPEYFDRHKPGIRSASYVRPRVVQPPGTEPKPPRQGGDQP